MLIYLSHEAKEKEWFSPTSPMMPIYLNHEAKVKSPTPPMIKITKHNDANFLIHEGKGKEWLSQFSKKSGYHFVGYQFVEIWLGFQFVGYQYSAHLFFISVPEPTGAAVFNADPAATFRTAKKKKPCYFIKHEFSSIYKYKYYPKKIYINN